MRTDESIAALLSDIDSRDRRIENLVHEVERLRRDHDDDLSYIAELEQKLRPTE